MLEGHRERKAEEAAHRAELEWQSRHDAYVGLIDQARTFRGVGRTKGSCSPPASPCSSR